MFADNVDPTHTALSDLINATTSDPPAVLAAPFDAEAASTHGVIICTGTGPVRTMVHLVEKPDPAHAVHLAAEHGPDNLRLLPGRARFTPHLLRCLAARTSRTGREPKLSLLLAAYARHYRLDVVTTATAMTDLGAPGPDTAAAFAVPAGAEPA
ncbi:hypothetical protein [Streptomyces sp. NPDC050422]|uniref:hypothetical protein n=1 Tax=Streptomyces sp. NPDC050422 TaxID=3365614 RepID=UPI0037BB3AE0